MTTNITLNSSFSSNKNLNILQINLGRTKAATTHLHPTVVKLKTDILLVQEPYVYNNKIQGLPMSWNIFTSTSNKAAIFIPQTIHKAITVSKLENAIAVKLHTDNTPITLISAYSSPIVHNINETLQEIQDIIRMLPNENFLVGADLNGHNPLWGYHSTNTRGVAIMDFLLANNLFINNSSDAPPTFTKNTDVGWPDLTFCSQDMITKVASWEVLEEPSFSDHQFIQTTIRTIITSRIFDRFKTLHRNHNKFQKQFQFHVEKLINIIKNCNTQQELNEFTSLLQATIIQACNKTFKIKNQPLTENPTWWTDKLEIEKKRIKALRRRAQRSRSEERSEKYLQWKTEVKKYTKQVKRAKNVGWKDLCTKAANPYGKHFKAAFRKTIHPSQLTVLNNISPEGGHQKIAQDILEQIFPLPNSTHL
ncbi:hypothetical protein HNY73_019499 [Argiope bruennichi]|uniref:Endonuclease/exonuclease/phosphatase domain-containing protein n=1 Tax=Argiope bruennichi TaxID=94029 RepID=A0A8T0E4J6_ARGBR|nr:hypothetical protein HNY73_019499 [Argiope bruennichi]